MDTEGYFSPRSLTEAEISMTQDSLRDAVLVKPSAEWVD